VKGLLVDSVFSNMKKLAIELGKKLIKLPSFIIAAFMHFIRKSIKK